MDVPNEILDKIIEGFTSLEKEVALKGYCDCTVCKRYRELHPIEAVINSL